MFVLLPLLVCIVGLGMWVLVDAGKYPKAVEIGKVMFWVGLLTFLLTWHGGKPFGLAGMFFAPRLL
jgi:hypothetical protein